MGFENLPQNPVMRPSPSAPEHLQQPPYVVKTLPQMNFADSSLVYNPNRALPKKRRGNYPASEHLPGPGSAREGVGVATSLTMDFSENPSDSEYIRVEPNFSNVDQLVRESAEQFFNHWPEKYVFDPEHPHREPQRHRLIYEIGVSKEDDRIIIPVRENRRYAAYAIRRGDFFKIIGKKDEFERPKIEKKGDVLNREGYTFFGFLRTLSYQPSEAKPESPLEFSTITLRTSPQETAGESLHQETLQALDTEHIVKGHAEMGQPETTGSFQDPGTNLFEGEEGEKPIPTEPSKSISLASALGEDDPGKKNIIIPRHIDVEAIGAAKSSPPKPEAPSFTHCHYSTLKGSSEAWIKRIGKAGVEYFIVEVEQQRWAANGNKPHFEEVAIPFTREGLTEYLKYIGGAWDEERAVITIPAGYDYALIGEGGAIVRQLAKVFRRPNIAVIADIDTGVYRSPITADPAGYAVRFDHRRLTHDEIGTTPKNKSMVQIFDGDGMWLVGRDPASAGTFVNQFLAGRIENGVILCPRRFVARARMFLSQVEKLTGGTLTIQEVENRKGVKERSPLFVKSRLYAKNAAVTPQAVSARISQS
ncbi:hypothetical protein HYW55_01225 [Candidatus Gottesmanbacteria bacterium]|nr:hypothetical protein [Candidatus Gottesmanbacteria bacterium]